MTILSAQALLVVSSVGLVAQVVGGQLLVRLVQYSDLYSRHS